MALDMLTEKKSQEITVFIYILIVNFLVTFVFLRIKNGSS